MVNRFFALAHARDGVFSTGPLVWLCAIVRGWGRDVVLGIGLIAIAAREQTERRHEELK